LEKFKRAAKKEDYTPEIKQKLDELKKVRAELKEIYSKQSKILFIPRGARLARRSQPPCRPCRPRRMCA